MKSIKLLITIIVLVIIFSCKSTDNMIVNKTPFKINNVI